MSAAAFGIGLSWDYLRVLAALSLLLFTLALRSTLKPSQRSYFWFFKYASLYMLGAMLLVVITGI